MPRVRWLHCNVDLAVAFGKCTTSPLFSSQYWGLTPGHVHRPTSPALGIYYFEAGSQVTQAELELGSCLRLPECLKGCCFFFLTFSWKALDKTH